MLCCVLTGDLNLVSTLLSNFFLASYSLINFSCFHASLSKSPGWRPSFKYYNLWVSLVGGIVCLIVMFLIDWITALITVALYYLFVSYRNPDVNWGSLMQAQTYVSALKTTLDLNTTEEHVKNYCPQLLVLTGPIASRPPLIDFAYSITRNIALLACGHVIQTIFSPQTQRVRNSLSRQSYSWLSRHSLRAFYSLIEGNTLEESARNLFQLVGLGKLPPNTLVLGYKANWRKCDPVELKAYFNTLQ
ncbi:Solute carrier family 12 member 2 [Chionoecetes opilio]|uniref:Solute carrier family 12 member 2 n=1 Tax=Chionoecetes opilio TaxID=41210 RepID=A0A8J4XLP1_CHIOP|nr:Solute carrier family 12 member 2 [Chionoecetes opilio]